MNTTTDASKTEISSPEPSLWDSIVIGGGPGGLAAALALGRSLRRVLVIDAGKPRNRFAGHMHTVLGHEGIEPATLLAKGRAEAAQYGAEFLAGTVQRVRDAPRGPSGQELTVTLNTGRQLRTRSVIAATGITDVLPDIPGLAERWGSSVLHCPYCHGWEVRNRRLGVLASGPMALHQAELLRQWSDQLTFFSAAVEPVDEAARRRLESRGIHVETRPVMALHGESTGLTEVELEGGRRVPMDALFTAGEPLTHEAFLEGMSLDRADSPLGRFIAVDQGGRTSHERIWAVGNLVSPAANVPMAISAGTMAGAMANMALISEEFDLAAASPAHLTQQ